MACGLIVRESKAKRLAAITNVHDFKSLDVSLQRGKGDRSQKIADSGSDERRQPPWHPAIQCLGNSQNVAGLWLKYGAKTVKIETSLRCKILVGERQFVDDRR
jgi:hypothetical protein